MTIQHVDIEDAERHENKGASTAGSTQALFGTGLGTSEFRQILFSDVGGVPVFTLSALEELNSVGTVNQTLPSPGTEVLVSFGAATTSANMEIDASGTVTIYNTGTYTFIVDLAVGRTGVGSSSQLFVTEKVNGVVVGTTRNISITPYVGGGGGQINTNLNFTSTIALSSGDTYEIWMVKNDSSTIGLKSMSLPSGAVTDGWPTDCEVAVLKSYSYSG